MTGVLRRCPNCGTVQPTDGECEACREAQVRYFCTNHTPGLWLDSAACPQCGARFGDPAPALEAPPAPPPQTDDRPTRVSGRRPDLRGSDGDIGPWGMGGTEGDRGPGEGRSARPDPARLLLAIFSAAARARRSGADPSDHEVDAPRRRRGGGCLGRLFMLALLLFALFLLVPMFLGALLTFG